MMLKLKDTKTSKIQSKLQNFLQESTKTFNNELRYIIICASVRFLAESNRNTSEHHKALGSRPELLIPHT